MFIILILFTLLLIALIGYKIDDAKSGYSGDFWEGFCACMAVVFCLALLILFMCQMCTISEIQQFKAVKLSVETARDTSINQFELATMQNTIIEQNAWLASNKYFQKNLFTSWFIPRSVKYLTPIK